MLSSKIKASIVHKNPLARRGTQVTLSIWKKDIEVIAEAKNISDLLELLVGKDTDILLLDINLPSMDGFISLQEIKKIRPTTRVLMTGLKNDDKETIIKAMEMDASSCIFTASKPEEIYEIIKGVFEKEVHFSEIISNALLKDLHKKPDSNLGMTTDSRKEKELTEQERKYLLLMCEQKSTKDIATIFNLGTRRIEAIRDNLKEKIGAKTTAGLVIYAIKAKIVEA